MHVRCLAMVAGLVASAVPAGAAEKPAVESVCTVAPDIVAVTIQAGRVEYGRQVPYRAERADRVDRKGHQRWVRRGGRFLGSLVGKDEKVLYAPDRLVGEPLDTAWADRPESYSLSAPGHRPGIAAVFRKSKPTDLARVAEWAFQAPVRHVVYLKLSEPLVVGKRYALSFTGGRLPRQAFTHRPRSRRSEAVHVSHLGFRPDDPAKIAFLSCWLGGGTAEPYPEGLRFQVLEDGTGEAVFAGKVMLAKAAGDRTEDAYKRNYNGTDVYEMDFAALKGPGTYRVYVEGIGCSYPFEIGKDVWRKAFTASVRGFFHQRSGIRLGPPHTDFRRPRSFHPGDGVKVYASRAALMDTGGGLDRTDSNFGNLVKGRTDEVVPNAWGGYMDAGDWDRRIQHLKVSRLLLELAGLFPDYFRELPLNIPESGGGLPDIVSEALWNLDCYRRMQTPDGGIRGGIESAEHPRHGEGSWQESLEVMAYAPGVWSSYEYAGVAARAAYWLRPRRPGLAKVYEQSARRAMDWAERELPKRAGRKDPHAVRDSRNLAAAELFRLTGAQRWHGIFVATTSMKVASPTLYKWRSHDQRDAAWVYLRTERPGTDAGIRRNCRVALLREADERVRGCERTGFRWTKDPWRPLSWGAVTAPDAVSLVRAHAVSGEAKPRRVPSLVEPDATRPRRVASLAEPDATRPRRVVSLVEPDATRYLRAAVLACQFGAGANPSNLCYTTGLGHESPRHPLHIDSRVTNQPPPPGLTVFGPIDIEREKKRKYWILERNSGLWHPSPYSWPTTEAFWDVFWYPAMCEFTVQSPMAATAHVWGYLAARR